MPLIPYRDKAVISRTFDKAFQSSGIATSTGPTTIAGTIKNAAGSIFSEIYDAIYDIAGNVMLSEAKGKYLARWGEFLGEAREKVSYAKDYSYNNAYIEISLGGNPTTAGAVTIDAGDIRIPSGVQLTSNNGSYTVVTVSEAIIRSGDDRGYCQVKSNNATQPRIPANSLSKCSYNIGLIDNIDPNMSGRVRLSAGNRLDIVGGYSRMSDNEYRFALTKKAEGLGTGNQAAAESTLAKVPDLIRFTILEHTHGHASVSVFIEARDLTFPVAVLRNAQIALKKVIGLGTRVFVYQPILRPIQIVLSVSGVDLEEPTRTKISQGMREFVNDIKTGYGTTVNELLNIAQQNVGNSKAQMNIERVFIGNREVEPGDIPVRFNEKLIMSAQDSIVFV